MKKSFLSLLLVFSLAHLYAQSNAIFYGGSGDGVAKGFYMPVISNVNMGGWADGSVTASLLQNTPNLNKGGGGDGFDFAGYLQGTLAVNRGGQGDGWTFDHNMPYIAGINKGGQGDAWTFDHNMPYIAGINKGGQGDGWSSTYTPTLPLPIIFLSFDAVKVKTISRLNWKMADDKEVLYFDVERSANAVQFLKIGTEMQQEEAKMNYHFTDEQPLAGYNYYRLKITKLNGKTEYTNTRVLYFDNIIATILKVYPNPAKDIVNIELPPDFLGMNTVINIYNGNGAIVAFRKLINYQSNKIEMNIAEIAAGNYFIHLASDDKTATSKITVLGNK